MKHGRKNRKFGRVRKQRNWLMRSLISNFIVKEKIETSEAKAKELKNNIDQIINKAKLVKDEKKKLAAIRYLEKIVDKPAMSKISNKKFIENFSSRNSGYCRVIKLAPRFSDSSKRAIIELIKDKKASPAEATKASKSK